MIAELSVVAAILGTRMPPSVVKVGTTQTPSYRSVQYFDNIIDLTNRVLNRTVRADVWRVHPEAADKAMLRNAQRNQQAIEQHCISRLDAEKISNPSGECGGGFGRTSD